MHTPGHPVPLADIMDQFTAYFQRPLATDVLVRGHSKAQDYILARPPRCRWCSNISQVDVLICRQNGAGPLILTWINEICSNDTEKRAVLVAAGNDFAYVVQAIVSTCLPIMIGKHHTD